MEELAAAISEFGFPVVMAGGMGYFIYFVWKFVVDKLEPELDTMPVSYTHLTLPTICSV